MIERNSHIFSFTEKTLTQATRSTLSPTWAQVYQYEETLLYPYQTTESYNLARIKLSASVCKQVMQLIDSRKIGRNTGEVLDFNLFLSANDLWSGTIGCTEDMAFIGREDEKITSCRILTDAIRDIVPYYRRWAKPYH